MRETKPFSLRSNKARFFLLFLQYLLSIKMETKSIQKDHFNPNSSIKPCIFLQSSTVHFQILFTVENCNGRQKKARKVFTPLFPRSLLRVLIGVSNRSWLHSARSAGALDCEERGFRLYTLLMLLWNLRELGEGGKTKTFFPGYFITDAPW